MRSRKMVFTLLILALALPAAAAEIGPYAKEAAATDGRRIFDIAEDFNRPRQDLVVYARMTLKAGDTISDTRKVIIKQKSYQDLSRATVRFIDSMKRGLTFLTIETHGPNNDQYLYAPAIGRPRQIASQDRQNNFEDTDFTNEDMGGLKLEDYTYLRGNDATIEGRACFKVTVTARAADARFPKRISWIDQQTFIPLQVKIYNQDNKLARVLVAGDIRPVGPLHLPFKTVAKDLAADHTTILEVVKAEADTGLEAQAFDKDSMGAEWKENF